MATRPEWIYGGTSIGTVRAPSRARFGLVWLALVVCSWFVAIAGALLIGRAMDETARQWVTVTRDGVTLTCERIVDVSGRAFYDSCERVP